MGHCTSHCSALLREQQVLQHHHQDVSFPSGPGNTRQSTSQRDSGFLGCFSCLCRKPSFKQTSVPFPRIISSLLSSTMPSNSPFQALLLHKTWKTPTMAALQRFLWAVPGEQAAGSRSLFCDTPSCAGIPPFTSPSSPPASSSAHRRCSWAMGETQAFMAQVKPVEFQVPLCPALPLSPR